jgi:acyl-CoA synthetase (AMP-forming)/AMP-acid ligase II
MGQRWRPCFCAGTVAAPLNPAYREEEFEFYERLSTNPDIYRAAKLVMEQQHGEEAATFAGDRADQLRNLPHPHVLLELSR